MTDDMVDDPMLDERIRRALSVLADSHAPVARGHIDGAPKGRGLLAVAAAVLVLSGVGALVLSGQRDGADRSVSTQVPTPVDSAAPDTTELEPTDATPSSGSVTPVASGEFRFATPLPDGVLAVLDPPPFAFVEAFRVEEPDIEFLTGRGKVVQMLVLDADGSPEATVSITDLDVPLDAVASGDTLQIGDGATLSYERAGAETFFVVAGSSIREIGVPNLRSTDNEFSPFDERLALAIEVATFAADRQLDDLVRTNRFAPLPALDSGPTVASYTETGVQGEGGLIEVAVITTRRAIDTDDFTVAAQAFGEILDRPNGVSAVVRTTEDSQLQYIEQISATQFVVLDADDGTTRAALDILISSLSFIDASEAGIDVETLGGDIAPVVARGDDSWGRWELYAPSDDDGCFGFGATVWSAGATATQQSSSAGCRSNDETPSDFVCIAMSTGELAGVYLADGVIDFGHPSIDAAISGETGESIDGLGTPTSFLIDRADADEPVIVLIDGEPSPLPCR